MTLLDTSAAQQHLANLLPKAHGRLRVTLLISVDDRLLPNQIILEWLDELGTLEGISAKEEHQCDQDHQIECKEVIDCEASR
jgi:hypothetical protein